MGPMGLALWAGTADGQQPAGAATWAFGLGSLAMQVVCWAALLLWMARRTTRLGPAPGTPAVDWPLLQARLHALAASGAPLKLREIDDTTLEVELAVDPSGNRAHRVRLSADTPVRSVQVRERLSVSDAAPMASESSFHRPGDAVADPVWPDVQRVHGRSIQTTPPDADDLAAWALQFDGAAVRGAATHPADWAAGGTDARGRLGGPAGARGVGQWLGLATGAHGAPAAPIISHGPGRTPPGTTAALAPKPAAPRRHRFQPLRCGLVRLSAPARGLVALAGQVVGG